MLRVAQGLRYTFRQLAKSPVFTAISILTIALGIGANTAIFSVMNAVLLHFLPVPNPQQLVYFHLKNQPLSTSQTGYGDMSMSMPIFEAMRIRQEVFADVIGFAPLAFEKVGVRIGPEPEETWGEMVSGNFFSGLQVQPIVGRVFTLKDESTHAPIAVLNYGWWKSRFAGDKDILGRTIYVKGVPFTIVGVAPPGFNGVDPVHAAMDFWIPLQERPELNAWGMPATDHTLYGSPNWLALQMLGRLRQGIPLEQAQVQLTPAFQSALANASAVDPHEQKPLLVLSRVRGVENLRDDYEHPLRFLMSMVALVLLIACANVVMLLLARNAGRLPEFCLRRALGASKRALFLQMLRESMLLVMAGAALGWLFAGAATQALAVWSGVDIMIEPDRRVLLFTAGVSAVVAIAFGLAPMWLITRLPLNLALRSTGGMAGTRKNRLWGRKLVVALQVSLCMVLLCSAGLLYRTLRNLESRDLGMRTDGLVVFGISPQSNIRTDADAVRFHTALLERMRALPGVDSATIMEVRIGSGGSDNDGVLVDGRNPMPDRPFAGVRENFVGSSFLHTLGILLELGREIDDSDTADSRKVAIVNQTFVDRYLPGVYPLGHHIASSSDSKVQYTIVGVAGNSRYTDVRETERPMTYVPFTQTRGVLDMQYELHTRGDPRMLIHEAAKMVHEIDPNLPLQKPITQLAQFAETISQERLVANLSVFFGGLAAFLVAIGLYGTISYGISRRTMEIGVRIALGAQRREVLRMVLLESLSVAAVGLGVGIPASLAVATTLRSMLYGLSSSDPLTILVAFAGITMVTLAAAFFPAHRAASIDPMRALRME
ncbi:MAG TPA: ABC transporter permease [Candidatus Acidoferrum sp.]